MVSCSNILERKKRQTINNNGNKIVIIVIIVIMMTKSIFCLFVMSVNYKITIKKFFKVHSFSNKEDE